MNRFPTIVTWSVLSVLSLFITGCGASGQGELRQWMAEQRSQTKAGVEPISEPKKFVPQLYTQVGAIDPFSIQRLAQSMKRESTRLADNAVLLAPELTRRKEALEAFPIDGATMVGSLIKDGRPVALVRVDNLLYQVREGNYLGQNYGRVTKISETEMRVREIVQDVSGEWIERPVTVQLTESSKK